MKFLMTGFEPFGGDAKNPSWEAISRLKDGYDGIEVVKAKLSVTFDESLKALETLIKTHNPDVVICVGLAGGRKEITIERIGINIDDARIADNVGFTPVDRSIRTDGPAAYFSNLPIKAMVSAIRDQGIAVAISNTAGTFVCNHVLYGLMDYIQTKAPEIRGGFVHVPYTTDFSQDYPEQPLMDLNDIVRAIEIAMTCISKTTVDLKISEGTVC